MFIYFYNFGNYLAPLIFDVFVEIKNKISIKSKDKLEGTF